MAGAKSIADASVVEPQSLLTEQLDPVLVPDLAISQATGQGSTFRGHEPNRHSVTHESNVDRLTTHVFGRRMIRDRITLIRTQNCYAFLMVNFYDAVLNIECTLTNCSLLNLEMK